MLCALMSGTDTCANVNLDTTSGRLISLKVPRRECVKKITAPQRQTEQVCSGRQVPQVFSCPWSGWTLLCWGLPLARWRFVKASMVVILPGGCAGECRAKITRWSICSSKWSVLNENTGGFRSETNLGMTCWGSFLPERSGTSSIYDGSQVVWKHLAERPHFCGHVNWGEKAHSQGRYLPGCLAGSTDCSGALLRSGASGWRTWGGLLHSMFILVTRHHCAVWGQKCCGNNQHN